MGKFGSNWSKKKIIAALLVVAIIVFAILEVAGVTKVFINKSMSGDQAKTTSKAETAQEDFTEGGERTPTTSTKNEGSVSDNGGTISSIPPSTTWTTSPSGAITVYTPAANSLVTDGHTLSGKSTMPKVSYRLIDDVSGVIAQGELSVVNGNFSGKFNFNTQGSKGRLDVFTQREDGVESNNVEIPIRFK